MIRVLIADDSPVTGFFLKGLFARDPETEVVGCARNGREAVDMALALRPDVVTMDVNMPRLNGYEATREIMESHPVPVVICSTTLSEVVVSASYHALEAGAVAAVRKPEGGQDPEAQDDALQFVKTVKAMSCVKLVRRWQENKYAAAQSLKSVARIASPVGNCRRSSIRYIAIGASTGGPIVIQSLLKELPAHLPVPILIVQHMAQGFVQGFRQWLASTIALPVAIAESGIMPQAGTVYLAPDTHHMGLNAQGRITLWDCEPVHHLKPAVAPLMASMAEHFPRRTLGVMLTGMGRDGAKEMAELKARGGITIVQNAASCVVNGMPGETVRLGGAHYIEPANKIADRICNLLQLRVSQTLPV